MAFGKIENVGHCQF